MEVVDKNQRERNLQEFQRIFLGTDTWGLSASLSQTDYLQFQRSFEPKTLTNIKFLQPGDKLPAHLYNARWAADGKSLTYDQPLQFSVKSQQPIEVDPPDLGYRLRVGLQQFDLEYHQASSYIFLGTFFFQPYEGNRVVRWVMNERERSKFYTERGKTTK